MEVPDWHHRVCQGEALTVQHTAGGPKPVPPSDLDVPVALDPRRWWREEIYTSQADQARWGTPPASFLLWALGSLKPASCILANFCTWALLRGLVSLWQMDQNSSHQLGSLSLSAMLARTQSLGSSAGSGDAGCLDLDLCWILLAVHDGLPLVLGFMVEGAGGQGVSDHSAVSFGFRDLLWGLSGECCSLLTFLRWWVSTQEHSLFFQGWGLSGSFTHRPK